LLRLHAERLSDITLSTPDNAFSPDQGTTNELEGGTLELRDVWFRYSKHEPWILKGCNLHVSAEESVAIVGRSGAGKSTIVRIALGLLQPERGEVLIGGKKQVELNEFYYRKVVSSVMQEDQLFAGGIGENICGFRVPAELEQIRSAARIAGVDEEVMRMPMRYDTHIGDMGSTLSSGQKQRILLARALYIQPSVLVLDEATSHLDPIGERSVVDGVRQLKITRLVVAHREETIALADRVLELADGQLRSRESLAA